MYILYKPLVCLNNTPQNFYSIDLNGYTFCTCKVCIPYVNMCRKCMTCTFGNINAGLKRSTSYRMVYYSWARYYLVIMRLENELALNTP